MRKTIMMLLVAILAIGANASTQEFMIQGSKGKLKATLVRPDVPEKQKVPIVLLFHGFTGSRHGSIECAMAKKLQAEGIASLRFDFNGHGESEGKFEEMTVLNEIEDAKCVYNYVSALSWVKNVSILGHSQGGVVASMVAGQLGKSKVRAVVLMAPAAVLRDDAIRGNTMGASYDPLNPPATVDLFGGLKLGRDYIRTAFTLPIYETAAGYKGPACILHGTGDRVVPYTYGLRFHQLWKGSEYHELAGEDHGFSNDLDKAAGIATEFLVKNTK